MAVYVFVFEVLCVLVCW